MASGSSIPARAIPAKSREVVSYHYDDERPGKPLFLLIPGGLIAVVGAVSIALVAYQAWVEKTLDSTISIQWILILLLPYFGGLFIFSYGYELYDWRRALRLTLIAGAIGLAAIVASVALLYVLRALLEGVGKSSSSKSSKSAESESWAGSGGSSSGGSSSSRWNINLAGLGGERRQDEERPLSLATCPTCGRPLPGEIGSPCPNCGPTPPKI